MWEIKLLVRMGYGIVVMGRVWVIRDHCDGRVWVIRDHCDGEGVGDYGIIVLGRVWIIVMGRCG